MAQGVSGRRVGLIELLIWIVTGWAAVMAVIYFVAWVHEKKGG